MFEFLIAYDRVEYTLSFIRNLFMQHIETRRGYLKLMRVGPVKFGRQSRWHNAPQSRGMWVFPASIQDEWFVFHRYLDIMPKSLANSDDAEAQDLWIKNVGKKVLKPRVFWYSGEVFSHLVKDRHPRDVETTEWWRMDAMKFVDLAKSQGVNHGIYDSRPSFMPAPKFTVSHLELFIAPNMGRFRDSVPTN